MTNVVLASGSPRRRELLARLIKDYAQAHSDVEDAPSAPPSSWKPEPLTLPAPFTLPDAAHPALWAWLKAADVAAKLALNNATIILAADTVVIGENSVLGKPHKPDEAVRMLELLRGKPHFVATGAVLAVAGAQAPLWSHTEVTAVWMRDYNATELAGYVATGEPLDKAGAYALQGLGSTLVSRVEGCFFNVVGLPLWEVREGLISEGVGVLPYPAGGYCDFCPVRGSSSRRANATRPAN